VVNWGWCVLSFVIGILVGFGGLVLFAVLAHESEGPKRSVRSVWDR
jgi:hypothetical protein